MSEKAKQFIIKSILIIVLLFIVVSKAQGQTERIPTEELVLSYYGGQLYNIVINIDDTVNSTEFHYKAINWWLDDFRAVLVLDFGIDCIQSKECRITQIREINVSLDEDTEIMSITGVIYIDSEMTFLTLYLLGRADGYGHEWSFSPLDYEN